MQNKSRFKASINGKTYTITGQHSVEHMRAVVAILNNELNEIKKVKPDLSSEDAAILLAINAMSQKVDQEKQKLAEKSPLGQ